MGVCVYILSVCLSVCVSVLLSCFMCCCQGDDDSVYSARQRYRYMMEIAMMIFPVIITSTTLHFDDEWRLEGIMSWEKGIVNE